MTNNLDKLLDRIGSVSKDKIIEAVLKDERAMALKLLESTVVKYIDYRIQDINQKGEA
jgi:hypothetical protein